MRQLFYHGRPKAAGEPFPLTPTARIKAEDGFYPPPPAGLEAMRPPDGWFHIHIPGQCDTRSVHACCMCT